MTEAQTRATEKFNLSKNVYECTLHMFSAKVRRYLVGTDLRRFGNTMQTERI